MFSLKSKLEKKQKKWNNKYFGKHNFKDRLASYIKKTHLDFGCGFGTLPYLLAKDYPNTKITGIDINCDEISLGKHEYKLKNLKLGCTDKITEKFDSISSFHVIHHLKDKSESYLKEFYKHLNPGGIVIIFDFRKVSRKEFEYWYDKKKKIGEYKDDFETSYKEHNRWTVEEFKDMMENISFKTIKSRKAADYWLWYVGKKI